MRLYATVVQTLGALALVAVALAVLLLAMLAVPRGRERLRRGLGGSDRHILAWVWIVAAVAMAGSLYFSDGVGFVPCLLCWYQRIAMYPLVLVLGVGLVRGDPGVWRYGVPLSVVGLVIAAYHVALQLRPSLEVVSCQAGAPCSARYVAVFGFVSIPGMAAAAFLLITALLLTLAAIGRAGERPVGEVGTPGGEAPLTSAGDGPSSASDEPPFQAPSPGSR